MKIYHIPAAPPLYTNTFLLVGENGLAAAVDPAAGAQEYLRLLLNSLYFLDSDKRTCEFIKPLYTTMWAQWRNCSGKRVRSSGWPRRTRAAVSFFRSPRRTTPMRTERRSAWTRISRSASSPRPATAPGPSACCAAVCCSAATRCSRGTWAVRTCPAAVGTHCGKA